MLLRLIPRLISLLLFTFLKNKVSFTVPRIWLPLVFVSFLSACGSGSSNPDFDGDGVVNELDAFPRDANESVDSDNDGVGDNSDAFPEDATETIDSDTDGVGDNSDAFPLDATESIDSDMDGVGNNLDAFPQDANENADSDGDGLGDNADPFPNDMDNNGIADVYEERTVSNESLVGTWVSFGSSYIEWTEDASLIERQTSKDYFVIRNAIDGLEMVSCASVEFGSSVGVVNISVEGDQVDLGDSFGIISSSGLTGTVEDNRRINTSTVVGLAGLLMQTLSHEMIKISDSTAAIGSVSITVAGEGTEVSEVSCFSQAESTLVDGSFPGRLKLYRLPLNDTSVLRFQHSAVPFYPGYQRLDWDDEHFDDDNQGDLTFTVDNLDDLNFSMSFNASNDATDISGNVQIQLPVQ